MCQNLPAILSQGGRFLIPTTAWLKFRKKIFTSEKHYQESLTCKRNLCASKQKEKTYGLTFYDIFEIVETLHFS